MIGLITFLWKSGAAEPGVQLHTHYLLLPFIKTIHFPKNFMNITNLHTHILKASATPENDAGVAELGVQDVQLHTHYLLLPLIKTIHFPKFLWTLLVCTLTY